MSKSKAAINVSSKEAKRQRRFDRHYAEIAEMADARRRRLGKWYDMTLSEALKKLVGSNRVGIKR